MRNARAPSRRRWDRREPAWGPAGIQGTPFGTAGSPPGLLGLLLLWGQALPRAFPLVAFWGGRKWRSPAEGSTGLGLSLAPRSGEPIRTFPNFCEENIPGRQFCVFTTWSCHTYSGPYPPSLCLNAVTGGSGEEGEHKEAAAARLSQGEPGLVHGRSCLLACPLTPETLVPNSIGKP